jgi:hypothetical protein
MTQTTPIDPSQEFYLRIQGRVQGPFTVERLRLLAERGRFARHHHLSSDGVVWHRAGDFPELFPAPPQIRRAIRGQAGNGAAPVDDGLVAEIEEDLPNWHYAPDGDEHGPITFDQLKRLALSQRLSPDDPVWTEGMPDWVPAVSVSGLFPDSALPSISSHGGPLGSGPQANAGGAVATLVLGLLALVLPLAGLVVALFGALPVTAVLLAVALLLSILGVVFGHATLSGIRQSGGSLGGRGMAVAGLVLSYIALGGLIVAAVVILILSAAGVVVLRELLSPR